jgi:hypothetical protein
MHLAHNEVRLCISLAMFVGGCYRPSFEDCQLRCDGPTGCPVELSCVEGYCRVEREPATICLIHDAGVADGPVADAPVDGPDPADANRSDAALADARPVDAHAAVDARPIDAAQIDAACTCNPLTQSCCPAGDACDVPGGTPTCRDVTVAGQQAAVCASATQCAAGYTCVNGGVSSLGTCHELCDADSDCVGGGALCDLHAGSAAWLVCTSFCDPLSGSGCEPGWACELGQNPSSGRWHSDCRPAGQGAAGDACSKNSDCGRGFVCAGSPARCASYCNSQQQDDSGCPGTPTCQTDANSPVIDGVTWGACL